MNYFRDIEIFSHISEEDQSSISDFCQLQTLAPNEELFHEGDAPQAIYVILEGSLAIYQDKEGEDQKIASLGVGELVGEMAFFGDTKERTATVIAEEQTTLVTILQFSLEQMLQKSPELHASLEALIQKRKKN